MNGQAFINALCYDVGKVAIASTDTHFRTVALSWLNRTIREISGRHSHWTWLEKTATFPTVANQLTYDLPTDIDLSGRKVFSLYQTETPTKLIYVDQKRFDRFEPDSTSSSGNPLFYTIWAADVRLWPVPDSVITMYMRYIKVITAFSDLSTSTSEIPDKYDEVVMQGMRRFALRMYPSWGDANAALTEFENGVERMALDNNKALDDSQVSLPHLVSDDLKEPYSFNRMEVGT